MKAGFTIYDKFHTNTKYLYKNGDLEVNLEEGKMRIGVNTRGGRHMYISLSRYHIRDIVKFFVVAGNGVNQGYKLIKEEAISEADKPY